MVLIPQHLLWVDESLRWKIWWKHQRPLPDICAYPNDSRQCLGMPRHFLYLLFFKIGILQTFLFTSFSLLQKNSASHSINSIMCYHFKAFSYSWDCLSPFVYFVIFIVMNTFIANSLLAPWNIYVDGELCTIIHGDFYESHWITKWISRRLRPIYTPSSKGTLHILC